MGRLRPQDTEREPLNVLLMALALALAAFAGAVLGFALDAVGGDDQDISAAGSGQG